MEAVVEDEQIIALRFLTHAKKSNACRIYYPELAKITGDPTSAIILSDIVFWYAPDKNGNSKLRVKKDGELLLVMSYKTIEDRLGINKTRASSAISRLEKIGLIERSVHKFNGIPHLHIRVNWRKMVSLLPIESDDSILSKVRNHDNRKPGFITFESNESSLSLTETLTETLTEKLTEKLIPQQIIFSPSIIGGGDFFNITQESIVEDKMTNTDCSEDMYCGVDLSKYPKEKREAIIKAIDTRNNMRIQIVELSEESSPPKKIRNDLRAESPTEFRERANIKLREPSQEIAQEDQEDQEGQSIEEWFFSKEKIKNSSPPHSAEEARERTRAALARHAERMSARDQKIEDFLSSIPEFQREIATAFCYSFGRHPLGYEEKRWRKEFLELYELFKVRGIPSGYARAAVNKMMSDGLTIKSPASISAVAESIFKSGRRLAPDGNLLDKSIGSFVVSDALINDSRFFGGRQHE